MYGRIVDEAYRGVGGTTSDLGLHKRAVCPFSLKMGAGSRFLLLVRPYHLDISLPDSTESVLLILNSVRT